MDKRFVESFANRVDSPGFIYLKSELSNLSKRFDYLKLIELAKYVDENNVRLTHSEAKELARLLPTKETEDGQNWGHIYEHLIYSRVLWEERSKLRSNYGVEGYYHPQGGSDARLIASGLQYIDQWGPAYHICGRK